jgi:hypothetical protein
VQAAGHAGQQRGCLRKPWRLCTQLQVGQTAPKAARARYRGGSG